MQIAYVVLIVAYTLIDRAAFAVSGAPTTRARREWTFWAVWVPYLACFAGPIAELALGTAKPSMLGMVAGALLVAAAAGLRWVGVTTLGRSFSASVETHDGHRLVDTGIFSVIRHPLYLGLALLYIGLPLFAGARWTWIAVALGMAGLVARTLAEERWLAGELPGYSEYMRRTKRLVPGVW
jgi:Putative protein-S-isoprenylcysteine methyltransferase